MKHRWLIVACGAALVVATSSSAGAADAVTGLEVKAEVRAGFRSALFPGAVVANKPPLVVPAREVWESGANVWTPARRLAFLRDTSARSGDVGLTVRTNVLRADRDPAQWLPAPAQRCAYVAKWIAVKKAWNLTADPAEVARLRRLVSACPASVATSTTLVAAGGGAATSAPTTLPTSRTTVPASGGNAVTTTTPGSAVGGSSALDVLAKIRILPEYTVGYDRDLFPHWKDLDGDGCDTRKEVLIAESRTTATVGSSCAVTSGSWYSPYDGATWTDPSDVDIDHVVALNEAWQSGAYAWSTQQRTNYANDLTDDRTLIAVTDSVNQSKSDKDPTQWLPPLASYRCTYLAHWVSVKARWSLAMDEAEHRVVASALAGCGGQTAAVAPALPVTPDTPVASPVSSPVASPATTAAGAGQVAGFVTPGAFCSPFGATGVSDKGVSYTCKPSDTEARNRWRR